jgi:hypothetical protein
MRGGKRVGAGRPVDPEVGKLVKVTIGLPAEYVAWAAKEGRGNIAKGVRLLLERLDQLEGQFEASQAREAPAPAGKA